MQGPGLEQRYRGWTRSGKRQASKDAGPEYYSLTGKYLTSPSTIYGSTLAAWPHYCGVDCELKGGTPPNSKSGDGHLHQPLFATTSAVRLSCQEIYRHNYAHSPTPLFDRATYCEMVRMVWSHGFRPTT